MIIPERRAVGLTPAAVKASAGAVEYLPVAREVNLNRVIERLKKEGVWIYGTAMNGEDYRRVNFSGPAALLIGSEGEGMSRLVEEGLLTRVKGVGTYVSSEVHLQDTTLFINSFAQDLEKRG